MEFYGAVKIMFKKTMNYIRMNIIPSLQKDPKYTHFIKTKTLKN